MEVCHSEEDDIMQSEGSCDTPIYDVSCAPLGVLNTNE